MQPNACAVNTSALRCSCFYFHWKRVRPKLIVEHLHANMHQSITMMNRVCDLRLYSRTVTIGLTELLKQPSLIACY